jgi:acetyl-CoA C-acetyltransferase
VTQTNVYIVSAQRTAVGSFQGLFQSTPAPKLGAHVIRAAVAGAGLAAHQIDQCIMGQVLTGGSGQAPARQAAIFADLATSTACMTINKVCGSGLKAVMLASDAIALGHAHTVVAGGQENMTLSPHLLERAREGYRMGNVTVADSMLKDGLWDPYHNYHMGSAAELCVREYKISREEQDAFAKNSYEKAQKAQASGAFQKEITAMTVTIGRDNVQATTDEEPGKARFDKMPTLKPAFEKDGTITAANASKINDGAAALVLVSEKTLQEKGLKPLAKIVAHGTFAQDPKWFTTAPVGAIKKALEMAKLKTSDIDLYEINEAFAPVTMVAIKELGLKPETVNVNGGAIAIGHPIGASGARLLTTLVHALHTRGLKRGLASLCIGGGEGVALVVEKA